MGQPILISTGGHHFVPLVGLTGCTCYIPAMVMRQFSSTQFIPNIEGFCQTHFYHESDREYERKALRKSWKKKILMERSPKGLSTT